MVKLSGKARPVTRLNKHTASLLTILALGQKDVDAGKVRPADAAFKRIRRRLKR